jgi:Ran GTPase-activating protein (RanGAP) involved in mRNA processing and transport
MKYYDSDKKELVSETSDVWKNATLEKFKWVAQYFNNGKAMDPRKIAILSDNKELRERAKDPSLQERDDRLIGDAIDVIKSEGEFQDYASDFSWRSLFIKLDFEEYLKMFERAPDFKDLSTYIDVCAPHLKTVTLPVISKKNLKSGHYWIMFVMGKLVHTKTINFNGSYSQQAFGTDGSKFLFKGVTNFTKSLGSLHKISIHGLPVASDIEKFGGILKSQKDLRVLHIQNVYVNKALATYIGKVLTDHKFVQELNLTNTNLDLSTIKEIADGLMRAKNVETMILKNNPSMGEGINAILYNLAFSPKIRYVDCESSTMPSTSAEALYKLIKITSSLEVLNINSTNIQNYLTLEFYKAIGENKTLKVLLMDGTAAITAQTNLSMAIAMNHKNNGSLKIISMKTGINTSNNVNKFFREMKVSDQDHEKWYGDMSVANKMSGEQLEKNFHFGLTHFFINESSIASCFNLAQLKKQLKPMWPEFILGFTTCLQVLNLAKCNLFKNDADLLATCLNNPISKTSIRVLNLSKNNLKKEGAKILALALETNSTLEELDFSGNKIGVSGAQAIA